jgi:Glucose / Sorbosone dehydrogenase
MKTHSILPKRGKKGTGPDLGSPARTRARARPRHRLRQRAAATMAVVGLLAMTILPAAAAPGLDERPSNTTCVAASLEGGGGGGGGGGGSSNVTAVNAFPSLKFAAPTQVRQHPNEDNRYYVAERRGVIRTFRVVGGDAVEDRVALDIRDRMDNTAKDTSDSEQWGITSFAFAPGFGSSRGDIFVVYNRKVPRGPVRSNLSRFSSNDGRTFSASSERTVLSLDQPGRYHHWGQIQFGPDGSLYLGSGDGSINSALARVPTSRFGKILKINVGASPARITNFAQGMRNPWRFTIDGSEMWVGDVGRQQREEVDRMRLSNLAALRGRQVRQQMLDSRPDRPGARLRPRCGLGGHRRRDLSRVVDSGATEPLRIRRLVRSGLVCAGAARLSQAHQHRPAAVRALDRLLPQPFGRNLRQ